MQLFKNISTKDLNLAHKQIFKIKDQIKIINILMSAKRKSLNHSPTKDKHEDYAKGENH